MSKESETNICINWPIYSDCDKIGTEPLGGYTDVYLCKTCHKRIIEDENRISQDPLLNQSKIGEENK